jgi:hypothetical protein
MLSRREDVLSEYLAQLSGKLLPPHHGQTCNHCSQEHSWKR